MNADTNSPSDEGEEPHAELIVAAARSRGMGRRAGLRCAANVGWSAFMGASLALVVMLLVPEGWFDAPLGFERLSLIFLGLWTLAIVPALSAVLLGGTYRRRRRAR